MPFALKDPNKKRADQLILPYQFTEICAAQISTKQMIHTLNNVLYENHNEKKKRETSVHLAANNVMVISFAEHVSILLDDDSCSKTFLSVKKPGSFASGNGISLLSINTTFDMLGLSSGLCCTHSKPTWMQRIASDKMQESFKDSSINSDDFSSKCSLHACKFLEND